MQSSTPIRVRRARGTGRRAHFAAPRRLLVASSIAALALTAASCESTPPTASTPVTAESTTTTAPTTVAPASPVSPTTVAPPPPPADDGGGGDTIELEIGSVEEIRFASGTSGQTVPGALAAGTFNTHYFVAAAGQRLSVELRTAGDGTTEVFGLERSILASGPVLQVDPLPDDGEYVIEVFSFTGGAFDYDLVVEITGGGGSGTPATPAPPSNSVCPTYTDFSNANGADYPMRLCQKGDAVREVQSALRGLGYDVVADGFFGPGTATAVGQWRGDGVGELLPMDIEALVPRDEFEEDAGGGVPAGPFRLFVVLQPQEIRETIDLTAGDVVLVTVEDGGSGTDPLITVYDPAGNVLDTNDDVSPSDLSSSLTFTVPTTGTYTYGLLSVNGVSGDAQVTTSIN